jgi:Flp pilus assembly protein TadB
MFNALSAQGAQIPLAAFSFAASIALLMGAWLAPSAVDRPVAIVIVVLLVVNGLARLVLWRNRARLH